MGIGNLGGFNPNINLNRLGANQKSNGNEKTESNGSGENTVNNAPQIEVQASALDMLGNLNRGLIGGKIKDLPEVRIGGEKDGPTLTQCGGVDVGSYKGFINASGGRTNPPKDKSTVYYHEDGNGYYTWYVWSDEHGTWVKEPFHGSTP